MAETNMVLTIDGGAEIALPVRRGDDHGWIAGPIPGGVVDVNLQTHVVVIVDRDGERDGWMASAGHTSDRNDQSALLHGRERFHDARKVD